MLGSGNGRNVASVSFPPLNLVWVFFLGKGQVSAEPAHMGFWLTWSLAQLCAQEGLQPKVQSGVDITGLSVCEAPGPVPPVLRNIR